MRPRSCLIPLIAIAAAAFATQACAQAMVRDQKVISSAGARAMVDACTAWAERNHVTLAMSVLDWAGNLIESHAMEGAAANAIDTALLKAKSALRWRRPTSEMNEIVRTGKNLAPTFMHDFPQPGALPIIVDGEVIGAMGVSSADGEKCAQAAIDAVFKKQGTPPAQGHDGVGSASGQRHAAAVARGAVAEPSSAIPPLGSANFGWQTNVADWRDPPPGTGHGPIKPDPAHPFTSNVEGARTGTPPTKRIGNAKDPVLKPWAAAQMQASNDAALVNTIAIPFAAQARCYPGGVPGQLLFPFEPLYFIQTPTEVWMIWQRDHQVRRVFLTDHHSEQVAPSWFGESIGHYENDGTLVVDTIGLSTQNSYIDNFRTPHSEKLHVVERFTIEPDGNNLTATVTVEDPDTFNEPLTMSERWFKVNAPMRETVCAENNFDYFSQGLFPVPQADKPDF